MRRVILLVDNDELVGRLLAVVLPLVRAEIVIESVAAPDYVRLEPPPPGAVDKHRKRRKRKVGAAVGPARRDIEEYFADGREFTAADVRDLAKVRGLDHKGYTNALHSAVNGRHPTIEANRTAMPFRYRVISTATTIRSPKQEETAA